MLSLPGRSFLIAATICLLSISGTKVGFAQQWADKMFDVKSHDFRTVGRGAKAEFHFQFKNLYKEDIHIAAVRTSCGCTTPSVTKDTVKSLETAAVVAKFNTDSFIGSKSATVTVVIDKPTYAEVRLQVKGFIRTDVSFEPAEVQFGELKSGETSAEEVTITKTGDRNWRITDVRSLCSDLSVRLGKPELVGNGVRYKMTVTTKPTLQEGDIRERLTLMCNDRAFPTTEMSVVGRVRPTLSMAPAALNLGSVEAGSDYEKKLVVRGDVPFAISEVKSSDKRFEFDVDEGEKKIHFVKLRFSAGPTPGVIAQEITVVSNLPGNKTAKCLVTGAVK